MALEREEITPGGPALFWAVCDGCQARGATSEAPNEALLGYHLFHGRDFLLCEACLYEEVPDPTVRTLINELSHQLGSEDLDLRPGSMLRTLVEASALAMGDLHSLHSFTEDRANQIVHGEILARVPEANLNPGSRLREVADGVVQSALRERNSVISSIVGSYVNDQEGRARLARAMVAPIQQRLNYGRLARSVFPVSPLPQGAMPIYDRSPGIEPWPDWVFVGSWIRPLIDITLGVCQIQEVHDGYVTLQGLNLVFQIEREESLEETWEPCEPPAPGPSRYERLSLHAELL